MIDFSSMSDAELVALRDRPIEICVVDIRGDKVRLGVETPKPAGVHRKEVWQAIRDENAGGKETVGKEA